MMITEIGPLGPALALVAVIGVVIGYVVLRREMLNELAKLRELVAARSDDAATSIPQVLAEVKPSPTVSQSKKSKTEAAPAAAPKKEEITAEILAVISAAVAQFLGAGARIRSTRLLTQPGGISPWAQQGRVIIQASHNLGAR